MYMYGRFRMLNILKYEHFTYKINKSGQDSRIGLGQGSIFSLPSVVRSIYDQYLPHPILYMYIN